MVESRIRNSLRNARFGVGNQALSIVLTFFSRTIFIRILGVEYLGINALFADLLIMLSMADLGFGTAMAYGLYAPLAKGDQGLVASLMRYYRRIYHFIFVSVCLVGVAISPALPSLINLHEPVENLRLYYLLALANTAVSYLFAHAFCIINADQKNHLLSRNQMITQILRVTFQVALLLLTHQYVVYLLVQICATVLGNVLIAREVRRRYPYLRTPHAPISAEQRHELFHNVRSVVVYKVAVVAFGGSANILISVLVGTLWVGYYSNYSLIINSLNALIDILFGSATASVGNAIVTESRERRYEIFGMIHALSLVVAAWTTICVGALMSDLVRVWLGSSFVLDATVTTAILVNFYIMAVVHAIWSFREATGLYRRTKYVMLLAAVTNILLSIIFTNFVGLSGVFIASSAARLGTYFWYEPRLLFREYFGRNSSVFFASIAKNAALTISTLIVLQLGTTWLTVNSWTTLVVKAMLIGPISLVIVLLAYHRDTEFKMLLSGVTASR